MERKASLAPHFPDFEPFELENDRRAWAIVIGLSAVASCALLLMYP